MERNRIELIPSKTVREYIIRENIDMTDAQWATIIYNLDLDMEKKHDLLKELAEETIDVELNKQIQERIEYDKKCMASIENSKGCFYEVSIEGEEEWETIGYFATLELAKKYGMQKQVRFEVKKYEIVTTEDKEDCDCKLAGLGYDKEGGMQYFYITEEEKVNKRGRFEDKFIEIPNPFEIGDIVRIIGSDECLGIVETSQEEWKKYLQRVRETNVTDDWVDVAITCCCFNEDLEAFHDHINPIFLEKVEGEEIGEGVIGELLQAGSDLMKGKGALSYFLYLYDNK